MATGKLTSILNRNVRTSIESLRKLTLQDIDGKVLTFSRIDMRNTVQTDRETGRPVLDENGNQIPLAIPVVVFEEIPDAYLSCSATVIKRTMDEWFAAVDGDVDELNALIQEEQPRALFQFDQNPKPGKNPTMFMYRVD